MYYNEKEVWELDQERYEKNRNLENDQLWRLEAWELEEIGKVNAIWEA